MIKSISITPPDGQTLSIGMVDNDPSGFTIVSITGLGPPNAILNTVGGSGFDGERMNSQRVGKRTISLTLAVNGAGDVEETRRRSLYRWFPIKKQVTFTIETDTRTLFIPAYVEVNDVNMFSKVENANITLVCPNPYFKDVETGELDFYGTIPMFQFPFSNESLTNPLIIMGEGVSVVENSILYYGDVVTGMILRLSMIGPVTNIGLFNNTYNESMLINTSVISSILGGPIQLGDEIIIDTRVGEKSVIAIRNGVIYNAINALDLFTAWLSLYPGGNYIVVTADSGILNIRLSVYYDILSEGV